MQSIHINIFKIIILISIKNIICIITISHTSEAGNAVDKSCLLAKTKTGTPANLFSSNKVLNSIPLFH